MDLMCPHCQQRVSVSDDKAGQVASCPLCAKQFMAPALPPSPAVLKPPAPPPPPPPDTYAMGPAPAPPPVLSTTESATSEPQPALPPPPPLPPGEYTHSCSCTLNASWLALVPTGCLAAIFVLSFFTWHFDAKYDRTLNLWQLSFTEHGEPQFLAYTILMFLAGPLTIAAMLFDKGWLQAPPPLAPLLLWKNLAVGALLGFTFLLLLFDYASSHFAAAGNPIALAMKLAFRLQFLAALAAFGLFWLQWRQRRNLPLPKLETRW